MTTRLFRFLLTLSALASLCACQSQIQIDGAFAFSSDEEETEIVLEIDDDVVRDLYADKIYYHVYIFDCRGIGAQYPAPPMINGKIPLTFELPPKKNIKLSATIPSRIFQSYKRACVELRGSTYLGESTVSSNRLPVDASKLRVSN